MAPTEHEQKQIRAKIKEFLKESDSYVTMSVDSFSLEEDIKNKTSTISGNLLINNKKIIIRGSGVGIVDAFLRTVIEKLLDRYPSLQNIKLSEFYASAKIKKKARPGSDATVSVNLVLENIKRGKIHFSHSAQSLNTATILVVTEAIEYFINSEIAFLKLKSCIEDAKSRDRVDIVNKYMFLMVEVVKNMNYDKVLTKKGK